MTAALLDRDLDAQWLDASLRIARTRDSPQAARQALLGALSDAPLGQVALVKTVTALSRVWLTPAGSAAPVLDWAIDQAGQYADWRPLHFGALLATQSFFRTLVDSCGRELIGRDVVSTVDLRRRMRDNLGPRRSVDIATQRGVKTLRSLGLLVGEFSSSVSSRGSLEVNDPELGAWLVRCLLTGKGSESIGVEELMHAYELFAVSLPQFLPRVSTGLTRHTEGVGRTVYALAPSVDSRHHEGEE